MESHSFAFIFAHLTSLRPQININPNLLLLLRKLERQAARKNNAIPSLVNIASGTQITIKTSSKQEMCNKIEKVRAVENERNSLNKTCLPEVHKSVIYAWA